MAVVLSLSDSFLKYNFIYSYSIKSESLEEETNQKHFGKVPCAILNHIQK